jgi:adenylate kinase
MSYVVLMGGPGAGKGTQAKRLQESLGLPHVASGDLFRENYKDETELGKMAKQYTDRGELVPDEVTVATVRERLSRPDCANGALLDGFPRTILQAKAFEGLLEELDNRISVVPYIHVSSEVMLQRLAGRWTCKKCGHVFHIVFSPPKEEGICDYDGSPLYQREDDTEKTQKYRIVVYTEQTAPLLAYYRERDLLAEVNGEQSIEGVFSDLMAVIEKANRS